MRVLRGLMLVVVWAVVVGGAKELGDSDWFALLSLVAIMGAWALGLWDASDEDDRKGDTT